MKPAFSLIIPANNEAAHIGARLNAVLASDALTLDGSVQIIVVPNGCRDDTADLARGFKGIAEKKG